MASKDGMLIGVLLDRSGSMAGLVNSVIEHFNAYKEEVSHLPNVTLGVFQFDTTYDTISNFRPIKQVADINSSVYYARGGTALLDGIGRLISTIDAIPNKPAKIVVVINTDGFENSSHEYNITQIREMITTRQNNFDWQFVFVGAGLDAFATGTSFGVRGHSTWTSPNTDWGYDSSYRVLTSATMGYSSGASASVNMEQSGIDLGIDQGTEEPPLQLEPSLDDKVNGKSGSIRDRLKRKKEKLGSGSR